MYGASPSRIAVSNTPMPPGRFATSPAVYDDT